VHCRFQHDLSVYTPCAVCNWRGSHEEGEPGADLWVCLICGFPGCGPSHLNHMQEHYCSHLHAYAANVDSGRVWDFGGEHRTASIPRPRSSYFTRRCVQVGATCTVSYCPKRTRLKRTLAVVREKLRLLPTSPLRPVARATLQTVRIVHEFNKLTAVHIMSSYVRSQAVWTPKIRTWLRLWRGRIPGDGVYQGEEDEWGASVLDGPPPP